MNLPQVYSDMRIKPATFCSEPRFLDFGLDSALGLFPHGLEGCRNPILDLADPRTTPDTHLFAKKKSELFFVRFLLLYLPSVCRTRTRDVNKKVITKKCLRKKRFFGTDTICLHENQANTQATTHILASTFLSI